MQNNQTMLTGQATPEQIAGWKHQHKDGIYAVTAEGHIAYFKNPGRHELNCAMARAAPDKALDVFEELAAITYLGGSRALLDDDQLFIGLCQELKIKLEGKKATLVNL